MSKFINKAVTGLSAVAMVAMTLISPVSVHAATAGGVYKDSTGTVWFVTTDMNKRPFTSWGAFQSYGFLSQAQIMDADSSVTALPTGAFIAPQDGRIFCATETKGSDVKGECSLITGGQKAAFTSAAVFGQQGFSFANAFNGDSSFLTKTSNIDNGSAQHRAGVLINNGGTVQLIVQGGLWGVPSMDVFNSWGWRAADVVPANSADVLLSQIGIIPGRMAGQLVPTATTGGSGGGLNGGAGDASITTTSADSETTVNEGASNTFVHGFKVQATGSDISVTSVKVTLVETTPGGGTGSTRLEKYLDGAAIYMGSTRVGSVSESDFTKSGTTYTASIPVSNAIVRMGSVNQQTFHIAISALNNIDSGNLGVANNVWRATASEIRFIDGTGVTLTDSYSDHSDFSFNSLSSSGDVKFKISAASDNPIAGNVQVSDTGSTSMVPLLKFRLNAVGSDITFDSLTINETATGATGPATIATEFELMKGSSTIQTLTPRGTNGTGTFNLDNDELITADSTTTYTIMGKIRQIGTGTGDGAAFDEGDSLQIDYSSATPLDSNGDAITGGNVTGTAIGTAQAFFSNGISVTDFTAVPTSQDDGSGHIIQQTFAITFKVTAFGNTYYIPQTTVRDETAAGHTTQGLTFSLLNSSLAATGTGTTSAGVLTSTATFIPTNGGYYQVADGSSETFHVSIAVTSGDQGVTITGHGALSPLPQFIAIGLDAVRYDTDQAGTPASLTLSPAQNYRTVQAQIGI